jgi:peptide/nickel transport system ATP-binding protein
MTRSDKADAFGFDFDQTISRRQLLAGDDLGVVASVADRVLVLESGRAREEGPTARVLAQPREAYTRSLLDAAPRIPQVHDAADPS